MRRVVLLLLFVAVAGRDSAAQQADAATQPAPVASTVNGRVEIPGKDRQLPVAGVMVTVHRVGTDSSGPLDSVRTNASGGYALRYRRFGAPDAIYFTAAVFRGIAYFSAPLKLVRASGDDGAITVFDTTSHAVEFHARGHHVVVGAPRPDGVREIVEVWEISNDTTLTVVGRDSTVPVWTAPLPKGATNLVGGQGDVAPDAMVARGNRVALLTAFGPGVKQLSYSYALPASAFPLTFRPEHATDVFEVLLEEPLARLNSGALRPTDAATTQGRTFQRFLGQDIAKDVPIEIAVPVSTIATRQNVFIAVVVLIVLVMVGALGRALTMRRARPVRRAVQAPRNTESMLAAIAMLDARRERGDPLLGDAEYAEQRAMLKTLLAAALVESGPPV